MPTDTSTSDKLLEDLWGRFHERKVRVVAFPVTPTPVYGLIYKPDCFMSRVFDHQALDNEEIKASVATRNGPAFLCYLTLSNLLSFCNQHSVGQRSLGSYVTITAGAYCARTSYFQFERKKSDRFGYVSALRERDDDGNFYAKDVDVHSLNLTSRSCNAGSHLIVPNAPYLTALLHLNQGMKLDNGLCYLSQTECADLFPMVDFTKNQHIDRLVELLPVEASEFSDVGCWRYNVDSDRAQKYCERWIESESEVLDNYDRLCLKDISFNNVYRDNNNEAWLRNLTLL